MEFRILGPLEVSDERGQVSLGGGKPRALLAVLLLHPNEVISADRLIDELWGEDSPERAAGALRVNVSRLRKALPPDTLTTRSPGSRRSGWQQSSSGSTPTSHSGATTSWSASSKHSSPSTRSASTSGGI